MTKRSPERTCVACGGKGGRDDLVRLGLLPGGEVVVDYRSTLPGRGAWVHPTRECVDGLVRRPGRLHHSLRSKPSVDHLPGQLQTAVYAALLDGLSLAAAGGGLVGGHDVLLAAISDEDVVELMLADDASERTRRELELRCDGRIPATVLPLSKIELGARIGQPQKAAVGVRDTSSSLHVRRQLRRLRQLGKEVA